MFCLWTLLGSSFRVDMRTVMCNLGNNLCKHLVFVDRTLLLENTSSAMYLYLNLSSVECFEKDDCYARFMQLTVTLEVK